MANDFSAAGNVFGVYNFESGNRTVDSGPVGTNTLSEANTPTTDTTNYKEGSASVRYTLDNNERSYRTDSGLSAGFPLKGSGGATTFSVTCWFRKIASTENQTYIFNKYSTAGERTFARLMLTVTELVGMPMPCTSYMGITMEILLRLL